ncbi:MAG: NACHT domain-containing protein [Chloroflexota bacterium]
MVDVGTVFSIAKAIAEPLVKHGWSYWHERRSAPGRAARALTRGSATATTGEEVEELYESLLEAIEADLGPALDGIAPEDEFAPVRAELANALTRTDLSPERLADLNYDPVRIEAAIMAAAPESAALLSERETELLRQVARRVSSIIATTATRLADADWAFKTIALRRLEKIAEFATLFRAAADRIDRTAGHADGDSRAATEFEARYRETVANQLRVIEFFGVRNLREETRTQDLLLSYMSLQATDPMRSVEAPPGIEIRRALGGSLPVEQMLAESPRLLILGPAGSGKSTVLEWFAVRTARRDLPEPLAALNDHVPFFVRLRDFENRDWPDADELPVAVSKHLAGAVPPLWASSVLDSGRGLVLVDGLDEVAEARRESARRWVSELVAAFGRSRFVVTSRPEDAEHGWLRTREFGAVNLAPLDSSTIPRFIDVWHEAQKQTQPPARADGIEQFSAKPKSDIGSSHELRELAETPLFCALLCALNHDWRGTLPTRRLKLLDAATEMMLGLREEDRGVPRESPVPEPDTLQLLLQWLAYWMLRNDLRTISEDAAAGKIAEFLQRQRGVPEGTTPTGVRDHLVRRTQLVRCPSDDAFEFAHETFRAYLGGIEMAKVGDGTLAVKHAHEPAWTLAITFAAETMSDPGRARLSCGLLRRGDRAKRWRARLHLLGARCYGATAQSRDADLEHEVESRLIALAPPTNPRDAEALAEAGDLALPYLDIGGRSARVVAASIVALGRIGTEPARTMMVRYRDDERPAVREALLRQWVRFQESVEYFREILRPALERSRKVSLRGLPITDAGLAHLEALDLLDWWSVWSGAGLATR